MGASDPELERKLQALRDAYGARLSDTLAEIERAWRRLGKGDWDPATAELMHRLSHGLAGSGSTFGYSQLSRHARDIEIILRQCLQDDAAPDTAQRAAVDRLLERLQQAALRA
jgi:HPt (histidine-containing phosphotransfer) domain-containing protein